MILNRQGEYAVHLPALRAYVGRVKRALRLGGREFNLCLVADREMARLNAAYRRKPRPTDVLSFPWRHTHRTRVTKGDGVRAVAAATAAPLQDWGARRAPELRGFLGDVAISVETARRNARREGHSTLNEIRWLVLHGVLHLLGYDHERDRGEMARLELTLREQLAVTPVRGRRRLKKRVKRPNG